MRIERGRPIQGIPSVWWSQRRHPLIGRLVVLLGGVVAEVRFATAIAT